MDYQRVPQHDHESDDGNAGWGPLENEEQDRFANVDVRQQNRIVQRNMQENLQDAQEQSVRFMRLFSVWAFIETVATVIILSMSWSRPCDKPLATFVLFYTMRFVFSLPLRYHRFRALREGRRADMTKYLLSWMDLFFFVWFVAGNVWVFGSQTCHTTAPALYYYALVMVCIVWLAVLLPLVVLLGIFVCFPCVVVIMQLLAEPQGASEEVIEKIPTRQWNPATGGRETSCCICMNDYAEGDVLRVLPCKHEFHQGCVDHWLKIKKGCPLCRADIATGAPAPPEESV